LQLTETPIKSLLSSLLKKRSNCSTPLFELQPGLIATESKRNDRFFNPDYYHQAEPEPESSLVKKLGNYIKGNIYCEVTSLFTCWGSKYVDRLCPNFNR
jgi:hypothetical protein